MYKIHSVEQATGLIPQVDEKLDELRTAMKDLQELQEKAARLEPWSVAARDFHFEARFLFDQIRSSKQELDGLGVMISDLESGQVGIPGQVGAEVVLLTWQPGQPRVTHYRRIGDKASLPLPVSVSQTVQQEGSGEA